MASGAGQQNGYQSNPYEQAGRAEAYGSSNPYGDVGNPYASEDHEYPQGHAGYAPPQPTLLSNPDFLSRVQNVRNEIQQLSSNVSQIGSLHQRALSSTTGSQTGPLESMLAQTQILNTRVKDQIKYLEADSAKSGHNSTKNSQIKTLKSSFRDQLQQFQQEESNYRKRYEDQIARQYRIINPEATDAEVREAASADWGNEGVFQTALKSNRTAAASSALGAVRARHNDIQQIERTMTELAELFDELSQQVLVQDDMVQSTEQTTDNVVKDQQQTVRQLRQAEDHARRARKLKWWIFGIVVAIIVVLAAILGGYFGYTCTHGGCGNTNHSSDSNHTSAKRLLKRFVEVNAKYNILRY